MEGEVGGRGRSSGLLGCHMRACTMAAACTLFLVAVCALKVQVL